KVGADIASSGSTGSLIFGNADLSLARGNLVFGNRTTGVSAGSNVTVIGNTIHDNTGATALILKGRAVATDNIVYANTNGVLLQNAGVFQGNRVYGNTNSGVDADAAGISLVGNAIYSTGIGVYLEDDSVTIRNNVIYGDQYGGIVVHSGTGNVIINNTIY